MRVYVDIQGAQSRDSSLRGIGRYLMQDVDQARHEPIYDVPIDELRRVAGHLPELLEQHLAIGNGPALDHRQGRVQHPLMAPFRGKQRDGTRSQPLR